MLSEVTWCAVPWMPLLQAFLATEKSRAEKVPSGVLLGLRNSSEPHVLPSKEPSLSSVHLCLVNLPATHRYGAGML